MLLWHKNFGGLLFCSMVMITICAMDTPEEVVKKINKYMDDIHAMSKGLADISGELGRVSVGGVQVRDGEGRTFFARVFNAKNMVLAKFALEHGANKDEARALICAYALKKIKKMAGEHVSHTVFSDSDLLDVFLARACSLDDEQARAAEEIVKLVRS